MYECSLGEQFENGKFGFFHSTQWPLRPEYLPKFADSKLVTRELAVERLKK
jgi:hypothetical protein